jgi:hypothetical protein
VTDKPKVAVLAKANSDFVFDHAWFQEGTEASPAERKIGRWPAAFVVADENSDFRSSDRLRQEQRLPPLGTGA